MVLNAADIRAKLIDPAIHKRGWTEGPVRREETTGTVEIINGRGHRRSHLRLSKQHRITDLLREQAVAVERGRVRRPGRSLTPSMRFPRPCCDGHSAARYA